MTQSAPFTITRDFDAPVDLLWRVHTESAHQAQWLSPGAPENFVSKLDFKVGGRHHYGTKNPDGSMTWGIQVFREIEPGRKVVALQSFADEAGNILAHPLAPTWPRQMLSTVEYIDLGNGRSRLSITWQPHEAGAEEIATFEAARPNMSQGWAAQFEQIESYLNRVKG